MLSFLDRERSVAPEGFNRWLVPPAALAVHLSIGQVYAFSVFKNPLQERLGVSGTAIAIVFSLAIVMLGLSAAFGGAWMERNGPRKTMFVSATCFAGGFVISALGVATGQLWLVYLGYGALGGIGLGLGYISPVSTLIKWFPDRPGLATGLAIMGFGGGAFIASALSDRLLNLYADTAAAAIVPAFLTLAALYFAFMMYGAFTVRVPRPGWQPAGFDPATQEKSSMQTSGDVTASESLKTKQFWLLWTVLFCNVTAGIGILEQASPMIQDFFSDVNPAAAAGYVGLLSICNMGGRFIWSSTSDYIGRKPTYMMFLGVGAGAFFLVASLGDSAVWMFVLLTGLIISFYGGGFATVPAYLKDMFGTKEVGAIHGRLLTAWSAAGVAGPLIVNLLAGDAQGEGAGAYRLSLFVMVGVLVVGFIANLMVTPVDESHHVDPDDEAYADGGGGGRSPSAEDSESVRAAHSERQGASSHGSNR